MAYTGWGSMLGWDETWARLYWPWVYQYLIQDKVGGVLRIRLPHKPRWGFIWGECSSRQRNVSQDWTEPPGKLLQASSSKWCAHPVSTHVLISSLAWTVWLHCFDSSIRFTNCRLDNSYVAAKQVPSHCIPYSMDPPGCAWLVGTMDEMAAGRFCPYSGLSIYS